MPSSRTRRALVVLLVAVAACTGDAGPPEPTPRPRPTPPALEGRLAGPLARGEGTDVGVLDLAVGDLELPDLPDVPPGSSVSSLVWGGDGSLFVTVDVQVEAGDAFGQGARYEGHLFRVEPDGGASRVGEPLPPGTRLIGEREGTLYLQRCTRDPAVLAIDPEAPGGPVEVAGGCPAALSEADIDGLFVASVLREGGAPSIHVTDLSDGSASRVARLDGLDEVVGAPTLPVIDIDLGGWGVAVAMGRRFQGGDRYAMAVIPLGDSPERDMEVFSLGSSQIEDVEWQPGGSLLALQECRVCFFFRSDPHGEIRLYDAVAGTFTEVAVSDQPFGAMAWSPDGSRLLASWREDEALVIDPARGVLGRVDLPIGPWVWSP